jgi:hypothetical protein
MFAQRVSTRGERLTASVSAFFALTAVAVALS